MDECFDWWESEYTAIFFLELVFSEEDFPNSFHMIKRVVLASLRGKELRKRDGRIGPDNSFPPRGSPLTSKIVLC